MKKSLFFITEQVQYISLHIYPKYIRKHIAFGYIRLFPKSFFAKGLFVFIIGIFGMVTLVFAPFPADASFFSNVFSFFSGTDEKIQVIPSVAAVSLPLLGSQGVVSPEEDKSGGDKVSDIALSATQDNALVASRNPLGTIAPEEDQGKIVVYTVQSGDTLGSIAESFGVSLNTILWANDIKNSKTIKVGDELVILPVSGIKYTVKKGDTLETIARVFKPKGNEVTTEEFLSDILNFNGIAVGESLEVGSTIIIPEGEFTPTLSSSVPVIPRGTSRFNNLPEFKGYYMRPIIGGRKSRGIHGFNGVDLANSCGLPVYASAEGTIIIARISGWNGGYGRYIVIHHSNGTQTLYGHLSAIYVVPTQRVTQGVQIGLIGSTGNSTGCHVHFEIRGARNPF